MTIQAGDLTKQLMSGACWFRIVDGDEIKVPGYGYSGKMTKKYQAGRYAIWHKASGQCFESRGTQMYVPVFYTIVEIDVTGGRSTLERANEIGGIEPGRNSRRIFAALKAYVDQLAAASAESTEV